MPSAVQQKIYDTIEELEKLRSIRRHYEETKKMLEKSEEDLRELNLRLDKELDDIEKLESISITGLFHKVLGDREEQVEKERQEYLEVSMKHQQHLNEIKVMEYELSLLEKKLGDISPLEKKLEQLKDKREKEIFTSDSPLKQNLLDLHRQMDQNKRFAVELTEALHAGDQTLKNINGVLQYLNEAANYADWGKMSKTNYHGRMKFNAVDKAVNLSYKCRQLLDIFARELKDVGVDLGHLPIQIDSFDGFLDRLFNNIISDWVFRNKLQSATSQVKNTMHQVSQIVTYLQREIDHHNDQLLALEGQKDAILLKR